MGIILDVELYKWDHRASFSRNLTIYTNEDLAKNFLMGFHFSKLKHVQNFIHVISPCV